VLTKEGRRSRALRSTAMNAQDLDAYCDAHQPRFVDELVEFCRIPSISADPAFAGDVRRSAERSPRRPGMRASPPPS